MATVSSVSVTPWGFVILIAASKSAAGLPVFVITELPLATVRVMACGLPPWARVGPVPVPWNQPVAHATAVSTSAPAIAAARDLRLRVLSRRDMLYLLGGGQSTRG